MGLSSKCSCMWVWLWCAFSFRTVAAFRCAALRFACRDVSELTAHNETTCSRSFCRQEGHSAAGDECRTRYSKRCPHCRHSYSKNGISEVYRNSAQNTIRGPAEFEKTNPFAPEWSESRLPDSLRYRRAGRSRFEIVPAGSLHSFFLYFPDFPTFAQQLSGTT